MNEHDRDLILGLTDGSLPADEAAEARARIAADPDLAAELAAQEAVRSDLVGLPALTLTETERSSLRSSLREQLHLDEAPAPVAEPSPRRRRAWWQPVLGVAAVAVFVTAVVILPNTLGGSDDAGDGEALSATTVAATEEIAEDSAGGDAAEEPTLEVLSFDGIDGSDLLEDAGTAATPDEVTDSIERENRSLARTPVGVAEAEACLEELGDQLPAGDKTLIGADETDDGLLVYFAVIDDGGLEWVVTVNLDECRVVDIDP